MSGYDFEGTKVQKNLQNDDISSKKDNIALAKRQYL